MSVKTNCSGCVFATLSEGYQNGCTLNRHDKLVVSDTDENNNFVLERFCNAYRPQDWIQELDIEEQLELESTVLNELVPRIGFFVTLDTSVADAIEKLDTTLNDIANINHGPAYVAVITDKVEYNEEIWGMFIKYFGDGTEVKYHVVQLSEQFQDTSKIVDEAFTHAQNGWIYTTGSGEKVNSEIVDIIHKSINIDLNQMVLIEPYQDDNGMCFPAYVFKFLNGNRTKIFQDEETSSASFIEKIKEAEGRGTSKSVFTWEELDAS